MSTERNDCATELRQTSVSGNGKPLLSRRRFNPARIFIEKDRLACNPKGFDQEDLPMFFKRAFEKASALRLGEEPEFKAKQLHQKAEISKIEILNTREDFVLTQVNGQLIRTGIFQEKTFTGPRALSAVEVGWRLR